MSESITSLADQSVTSGQKDQLLRFVSDAARNAAEEAVAALFATANREGVQQVLGTGQKIRFATSKFLQEQLAALAKIRLKCISGGKKLTLMPTDGKRTIAQAGKLFDRIEPNFKCRCTDVPGDAKPETDVVVHELIENSTFAQMFGFLSEDTDRLCFSQDQIVGFVETFRDWFHTDSSSTFFLFKIDGKFFVADVRFCSGFLSGDTLEMVVHEFSADYVWGVGYRHRVVVPQLTR